MEIFADTYDVDAIERLKDYGILSGVTTNPSILAKSGRSYDAVLTDIAGCLDKGQFLAAQVMAEDADGMVRDARALSRFSDDFIAKLPITPEGLKACRILKDEGMKVIATVCLSPTQALLAAKCGADYVAPYLNRLNRAGEDGIGIIQSMQTLIDNYGYDTKIMAASIKSVKHVIELGEVGVGTITTTPDIIDAMYTHALAPSFLEQFAKDWQESGQPAIVA